jgi:hypothetical protein
MMRDESLDAPIPERFEPSDYHPKKIAELEVESKNLEALAPQECRAKAEEQYQEAAARNQKYIAEARDLEAKYRAMLAKVEAWEPPTQDHRGLKEFMAQQIRDSIPFDCGTDYWEKNAPVRLSWADWRNEQRKRINKDLAYHRAEYAKEVERTEERNNWIAELRRSLKSG